MSKVKTYRYSKELRSKAAQLYLQGWSVAKISREKDMPSRNTLMAWRNEDNWNEISYEVTEKTKQKVADNLSDIKAKQHSMILQIYEKFLTSLHDREKPAIIPANLIPHLMKHELLLLGEATERTETKNTTGERLIAYYKELYGED